MPPCLTLRIIRYGSRVSGAIPGRDLCPLLHLSLVAIEKGAFGLSSTMVDQLTYLLLINLSHAVATMDLIWVDF